MHRDPIFARGLYPSVHAATIAACDQGTLLAAWFAGTHEGAPDVAIYTALWRDGAWSAPMLALRVPEVPCWNPVLFRRRDGSLWLYLKAAPTIPAWTGLLMRWQPQHGHWSPPEALPAGLQGPAKNKPIELQDGTILCGASREAWRSWACWVERSADGGATWSLHGPITAPASDAPPETSDDEPISATWDPAAGTLRLPNAHAGVIQPTLWESAPGHVVMLMRATQRLGHVCRAESHDGGRTWSPAQLTPVPCPNSGLDAVRLADGRVVLACNPVHQGRTPLALLVSKDDGLTWRQALTLEDEPDGSPPPEYSYPSIIQAPDGRIHVVYTWRRERIEHAALDPAELT